MILVGVEIIFGDPFGALIACGLGYAEGFILKGSYIIKLPIFFYTKIEHCLPKYITNYKDM